MKNNKSVPLNRRNPWNPSRRFSSAAFRILHKWRQWLPAVLSILSLFAAVTALSAALRKTIRVQDEKMDMPGYHEETPVAGQQEIPINGQQETPVAGQQNAAAEYAEPDVIGHSEETFILDAEQRGFFQPLPDGLFHPDDSVTRAQFAFALWTLSGQPEISAITPFADTAGLPETVQTAIAWNCNEGYIDSLSPGMFSPDGLITRQEAVNALFRRNGSVSGVEGLLSKTYDDAFTDSGEIAAWGKEGMYWGIFYELIVWTPSMKADPDGTLTRAQASRMLVKYMDRFGPDWTQ